MGPYDARGRYLPLAPDGMAYAQLWEKLNHAQSLMARINSMGNQQRPGYTVACSMAAYKLLQEVLDELAGQDPKSTL